MSTPASTEPTRPSLSHTQVSAPAQAAMAHFHAEVVREVVEAVAKHPVVVVGMAQNPHIPKVKSMLREANVDFEYLEYGSYFGGWHKRLAIKLWSGWPTFPQVFVRGTLLGGENLTRDALADGTLKKRLEQ